jgi:hypothetical protein
MRICAPSINRVSAPAATEMQRLLARVTPKQSPEYHVEQSPRYFDPLDASASPDVPPSCSGLVARRAWPPWLRVTGDRNQIITVTAGLDDGSLGMVVRHPPHDDAHHADPSPPREQRERQLEEACKEPGADRPPSPEGGEGTTRDLLRGLCERHPHRRTGTEAAVDWARRGRHDIDALRGELDPEPLCQ